MDLDKKDKQLLHQLYLDSRQSFKELGKKLHLSGVSVERRMRRLQKEGVLVLLFADMHFGRLGLKSYRLYFKFDVMDEKTEKGVIDLFHSYPRTLWGVICEGEYDVLWRIIAKDEVEVENAAYLMIEKFGSKIVEKTIITTTYQTYLSWNKAFSCERASEFPSEGIDKVNPVDSQDMKLLKALYDNARESTVSLAKKCGLSPDAVSYRIKRLQKDGYILGFSAWYDAKKLGYNYYKILIGFRNISRAKEKKFWDYCASHDAVIFMNKTIGSWDIEVDVIMKDNEEMHEFMRDIKTRFGHVLGKHTFINAIYESMLNPIRGE